MSIEIPGHTLSHIAFHGAGVVVRRRHDVQRRLRPPFRRYAGADARVARSPRGAAGRPRSVCCGHEYTAANCAFALSVDPDNVALRERSDAVRALRSRGAPTLPVDPFHGAHDKSLPARRFIRVARGVQRRDRRGCGAGPHRAFRLAASREGSSSAQPEPFWHSARRSSARSSTVLPSQFTAACDLGGAKSRANRDRLDA